MRTVFQLTILLGCAVGSTGTVVAQMPFSTDNADVTGQGTLHFEFFNELDGLQPAQYPDLRTVAIVHEVPCGFRL